MDVDLDRVRDRLSARGQTVAPPAVAEALEWLGYVVSDAACGLSGVEAANTVCVDAFLTGSCYGDSGGPLWGVKDGNRVQIGIVSRGFLTCVGPGMTTSYTEVNSPSVRDFVHEISGV